MYIFLFLISTFKEEIIIIQCYFCKYYKGKYFKWTWWIL